MDSQTRQEFVRAAVVFLQNPKLTDSSLKDKLKFLKDKGLSEIEVDEALNLALVNRNQTQGGKWNFLLILGLCIGGYKLYQAYIESKAKAMKQHLDTSGRAKNTQSVSQVSNNYLNKLESNREENQPTLNDILQKMNELRKLVELQRSNMGAEIQSLKTLLLSHEKFAAPPKIPAWQLGDTDTKADEPSTEKETTREESSKGGKKSISKNDKSKKTNLDGNQTSNNGISESVIAPTLQ